LFFSAAAGFDRAKRREFVRLFCAAIRDEHDPCARALLEMDLDDMHEEDHGEEEHQGEEEMTGLFMNS
jgi:hypothetical protein